MTKHHPDSPTPLPASPTPQAVYMEEPINWREYWQVLVEHKKLIGIITAASTILALLAAFLITPIYRAEVLLAPVPEEKAGALSALAGQFGDLAALAGVNLGDNKEKIAESIAALKSRSLSTTFINQESLKPALFPGKWDAENKKWKDPEDIPTDWDAFEVFDRDIRFVQADRKTGLVTLAIEWKDPSLAARWANDLVKHVNDRLRTDVIKESDRSIGFLEKQLSQTSAVEVQQSIYRLIEVQTKRRMVANTREEFAFKVIDAAVAPERKIRPKRLLITMLGFVVGLMLAVSVVFIRNATNTRRVHTDYPRR